VRSKVETARWKGGTSGATAAAAAVIVLGGASDEVSHWTAFWVVRLAMAALTYLMGLF
jgi:hypothetical protein